MVNRHVFTPLTNVVRRRLHDTLNPESLSLPWSLSNLSEWTGRAYFNIFVLLSLDDIFETAKPEELASAIWLGTTSYHDGCRFRLPGNLEDKLSEVGVGKGMKVRFYVQGVTALGEVLDVGRCDWVNVTL